MSSKENDLSEYDELLEGFLIQGYEFTSFSGEITSKGKLILRHDIDFSTAYALKAAEIEAELGIMSTYFFLLKAPFYNVLVPENFDQIEKIRHLGHKISVHFDPALYKDVHQGLADEIGIFQNLFGESVDIISLHRPSELFLGNNDQICGVDHTYMPKYFNNLKYFADSSGKWRYGHPFDSVEFEKQDSLQILIHPIWWFIQGETNFDKIQKHYEDCIRQLFVDFEQNSKPFREIKQLVKKRG